MLIWFILSLVVQFGVTFAAVDTKINEYFVSDAFKTIQKQWQIERKAFENAIAMVLQQNYGHRGMNVYVRRTIDPSKIADGFYFSDNVVGVVLLRMYLQDIPNLIAPDVQFALAANRLGIEAKLSKIIINTKYLLIRNQSDITFAGRDVDLSKRSPFTLQQVHDSGELTIVADDCTLDGYTITSLKGDTVNLGFDAFKVKDCKFTIEIYSPGVGSPPVIAPYFSKQQSEAIERMISTPIRAELMAKLQASVFTYINTSAMFEDKLPDLRSTQKQYFKQTADSIDNMVKNYAKNAVEDKQGTMNIKPLDITWKKASWEGTSKTYLRLTDMILYGLDTVYSAHIGGPYKLQSIKVAETIRFSTIQVRGNIYFENNTAKGQHDFAVELQDVAVNVQMEGNTVNVDFIGWRALELSILNVGIFAHERTAAQSLITGYLINEIPKRLVDHLSNTFGDGRVQPKSSNKDGNLRLVQKQVNYFYSQEDLGIQNQDSNKDEDGER